MRDTRRSGCDDAHSRRRAGVRITSGDGVDDVVADEAMTERESSVVEVEVVVVVEVD
jgi:hypothetical protein